MGWTGEQGQMNVRRDRYKLMKGRKGEWKGQVREGRPARTDRKVRKIRKKN